MVFGFLMWIFIQNGQKWGGHKKHHHFHSRAAGALLQIATHNRDPPTRARRQNQDLGNWIIQGALGYWKCFWKLGNVRNCSKIDSEKVERLVKIEENRKIEENQCFVVIPRTAQLIRGT